MGPVYGVDSDWQRVGLVFIDYAGTVSSWLMEDCVFTTEEENEKLFVAFGRSYLLVKGGGEGHGVRREFWAGDDTAGPTISLTAVTWYHLSVRII